MIDKYGKIAHVIEVFATPFTDIMIKSEAEPR